MLVISEAISTPVFHWIPSTGRRMSPSRRTTWGAERGDWEDKGRRTKGNFPHSVLGEFSTVIRKFLFQDHMSCFPVLVYLACHSKIPQTELENRLFSHSSEGESRDHSASRVDFFWGLSCKWPTSRCLHMIVSLQTPVWCFCVQISCSCKDRSQLD